MSEKLITLEKFMELVNSPHADRIVKQVENRDWITYYVVILSPIGPGVQLVHEYPMKLEKLNDGFFKI